MYCSGLYGPMEKVLIFIVTLLSLIQDLMSPVTALISYGSPKGRRSILITPRQYLKPYNTNLLWKGTYHCSTGLQFHLIKSYKTRKCVYLFVFMHPGLIFTLALIMNCRETNIGQSKAS